MKSKKATYKQLATQNKYLLEQLTQMREAKDKQYYELSDLRKKVEKMEQELHYQESNRHMAQQQIARWEACARTLSLALKDKDLFAAPEVHHHMAEMPMLHGIGGVRR